MEKYNKIVGNTLTSLASTPQEQLLFLNQFGGFYFWLNTLGALLLCILFRVKSVAPNIGIIAWLSAVVLLAIGCWAVKSRFKGKLKDEQLIRYRLLNLILCAVWGMSGVFLFSSDPVVHSIHLCLLLVIALSVWPMSIVSSTEFYIQLALLLAPITLMLAIQQDMRTNLLCFVVLAFTGTAALMAHIFMQILNHLLVKEKLIIEQVSIDPVTELMSSKHFDQTLKREWYRCARSQQPLSLIIIEANDFHAIERELDTKATQEYLQNITKCLRAIARRSADTLSYYDDAEFIILLPDTKLEAAKKIAERLHNRVQKSALPNPLAEGQFVTISTGVASCVPVTGINKERERGILKAVSYPAGLLEEAEQALNLVRKNRAATTTETWTEEEDAAYGATV